MAIEFMLVHELAWRVAAPRLLADGRATVPENVGLALLLGAIPEAVDHPDTPDYLRAAATTAGFGPAALRTIEDMAAAELRPQAIEAAASAASDPARLRLLARLWSGFQAGANKARLVDRANLYSVAATALPSPLIGSVVVCTFDDPSPTEWTFLEGLSKHHALAAVSNATSPDSAPRRAARQQALNQRLAGKAPKALVSAPQTALERVQQRLFDPAGTRVGDAALELEPSIQVLSAAGESLEAVEIARLIQEAADQGVRYQEIGVLLRSPDAYGVALASAFDRAGIDAFFVEGVPRVDPAARGLSLLLDLIGADLDRGRVMEFLQLGEDQMGQRPRCRLRCEPVGLGSPFGARGRRFRPRHVAHEVGPGARGPRGT